MARSQSSVMAVLMALVAPQGLVVLEAQIALEVPVVRARLSDQAHPDRKPPALPP
jgi:hypothetical protein